MTPKSGPLKYPDRDPQMFYELARDRHSAQAQGLDLLDTKLSFFLSSSSALLAILVAVYALREDGFNAWEWGLPVASGAAWLALTMLALSAFQPKKWLSGPKLQETFDLHSTEDETRLKWRVAHTFWCDYETNRSLEGHKVRALKWSRWLFIAQTAFLVAALVLVALFRDSDTSRHSRSFLAAAFPAQAPALVDRAYPESLVPACLPRSSAQDLSA
jgi:hypothetical protein